MDYRPIPPTEYESFAKVDAIAFGQPLAAMQGWLTQMPDRELRGLYVGEQCVSQLELIPFEVQTGHGTTMAVGGLGSVATPVEYRRRGYVGALLRACCEEMRERGMSICLLDPFKASFYGQYGWASATERALYRAPISYLAPFARKQTGQWHQVGVEAISDLNTIYNGALSSRFGPIVRSDIWWERTTLDECWAYLWRDQHGNGRSYVLCSLQQRADKRVLVVREAVALDPLARSQIFALLANHDSKAVEFELPTPPDAPINALMPDPLRRESQMHYMARLLNIPQALQTLALPIPHTDRITIAVIDEWLPDQAGTYALESLDGAVHCTRTADASSELTCDVRVLAQIATRFLRPRQAATFGVLTSHNRTALLTLEAMFAGLAPYCPEWF